MPASTGTGSQLVMRAREAAQRATAAAQLGIARPMAFSIPPLTNPMQPTNATSPNQPYQPPTPEPPIHEKAYGDVEAFLRQFAQNEPTDIGPHFNPSAPLDPTQVVDRRNSDVRGMVTGSNIGWMLVDPSGFTVSPGDYPDTALHRQ